MPTDLAQTAHSGWDRARQHIFDSWTYETDPANLQPKVRKLNREVAEYLRQHPPAGVEQDRLERCLDAIECPWSRREENLLRTAFRGEYENDGARSQAIVAEVEQIGVEPFEAPEPLPTIEPDDIHLICWLAIEQSS